MLIKKGDIGENVRQVQQFLKVDADGIFGFDTEKSVKDWQNRNGLTPDGLVGPNTIKLMGLKIKNTQQLLDFDEKYKDLIIQGASFPDDPIRNDLKVSFTKEMLEEYIPTINKVMSDQALGFRLLCTIMAEKEGFKRGTRSYRNNNPGNIGDTDAGSNKSLANLADGILLQKNYILKIAKGENFTFPMGKRKIIKPYFSREIAKNSESYRMSPYLPGYEFIYNGQLDQFIKIYSTGARARNSYLSTIISYFKENGLDINAKSKIQDIIYLN